MPLFLDDYNETELNILIKEFDNLIEKYSGILDIFEDSRDSLVKYKRERFGFYEK